jgi:flagellar biosynthesis/type III secretory pathway protein FliH
LAEPITEVAPSGVETVVANRRYISDFARKHFRNGKAEGKAEGRAEGKAEGKVEGKVEGKAEGKVEGKAEGGAAVLLILLSQRFGVLSETTQNRIRSASIAQLESLAQRLLTASTLGEAPGELR